MSPTAGVLPIEQRSPGTLNSIRIASWNVNGIKARTNNLLSWLEEREPDVLCLQELKGAGRNVPVAAFDSLGYQIEATEHVGLASRHPLEDVHYPTSDGRTIAATVTNLPFLGVYAPNGRKAGTPAHRQKVQWLHELDAFIAEERPASTGPFVLLGDFNVALEPEDVWKPENYRNRNLFTSAERAALAEALVENQLVDTFRHVHTGTGLYTWWNYAHDAFNRKRGWRLDYIFTSPDIRERTRFAVVDVVERGRPGTSDHAPLWIDLGIV